MIRLKFREQPKKSKLRFLKLKFKTKKQYKEEKTGTWYCVSCQTVKISGPLDQKHVRCMACQYESYLNYANKFYNTYDWTESK